ncbi:hypothetical protein H6F56_00020 [Microcoleus sp. FACHB-672]|nr:hypothetical protein [Microcoleus sp. FACHB-672]
MFYRKKIAKQFVSTVALVLLLWIGIILGFMPATAVNAATATAISEENTSSKMIDQGALSQETWYDVDQALTASLRKAYESIEEYATDELDDWVADQMKKVDEQFLSWYFSYLNQKAMEFGVPFAWLTFQLDSALKVLRSKDEKTLNADQIIQKRMIEDFNNKFNQLVLNEEAETSLKKIIERVGRNYASGIGYKFSEVKAKYRVSEQDWNRHLKGIAQLIYNTGNSQYSLSPESINSELSTKIFALTTVAISAKLGSKFAAKAGSKLAVKASASTIAKTASQLIDPLLAVGFLAWDIWDFQNMVSSSRPELRQNIWDYLDELKKSILYSPDNSIKTAIEEIEEMITDALNSQPIS